MGRERVQRGRDTQHAGASNENPVQGERNTKKLVANTSEEFAANVVDAVHIRMCHFEDTDDVVGPTCHGSDDQDDDYTGNQAQAVKDRWNGKDTQTNLSFQHEHGCTFPANLLTLAGYSECVLAPHTAR